MICGTTQVLRVSKCQKTTFKVILLLRFDSHHLNITLDYDCPKYQWIPKFFDINIDRESFFSIFAFFSKNNERLKFSMNRLVPKEWNHTVPEIAHFGQS